MPGLNDLIGCFGSKGFLLSDAKDTLQEGSDSGERRGFVPRVLIDVIPFIYLSPYWHAFRTGTREIMSRE